MNKENKNLVIMALACSETLIAFEQYKLFKPYLKWLRTANTYILKAMDEIIKQAEDKGEFEKLYKYAKDTHIEVHPNAKVVEKGYSFVADDVLDELTKHSLMDCGLCMKAKHEIKQCKLKKALDHIGVEERGGVDCPYKMI